MFDLALGPALQAAVTDPQRVSEDVTAAPDRQEVVVSISADSERLPEAPTRASDRPVVSFAPAAIGIAYAWVAEGSGRAVVAAADPVFAALVGSTTAGLAGRALEELTDPQAPAVGQARFQALLDGSSATYQVQRAISESGGYVELTVSLLPLHDQSGRAAVVQVRDLTRQHEAERAAHESLMALQRSNRELESFAMVAAHDLAAPLRVVVGYTEILRDGNECSPQMAELLEKLAGTSRRMQAQVDGLMMLARVEADELSTGQYDLRSLIEEALGRHQDEIKRRRAAVEVGAMPIAVCNATGVVQVFANLIANALKYGGTRPSVSVEAVRISEAWQFTVADRGIGLPEGDACHLFELFQRGPELGRVAGAGIGLAVCQRIVARHGGWIWCARRPGGGSEFHFTLPDRHPDAGSKQ
jgi:PAS domain S-box-containing protein